MNAEISVAHWVTVLVVQVPVDVLELHIGQIRCQGAAVEDVVIPSAAPAPRLVGELPSQDRGLVLVPPNERRNVTFESGLRARVIHCPE